MQPYDTGMDTTPGMWEFLSEELEELEVKLPLPLSKAIIELANDRAQVVRKEG